MNPVIFIVGPTATGKSHLALSLAHTLGAGILNCDSLQVYKRLDIGTAKPPLAERSQVPHYLFDFVEPGHVLTAGDFRKKAMEVLRREVPRRPVVAVGGSGFYLQALEKGLFPVPKADEKVETAVRGRLQTEGLEKLYLELREKDPEYSEVISPNDSYRIVRALVVMATSGTKMSVLKSSFTPEKFPFPKVKFGLNLDVGALRPRVEKRVQAMLDAGLLAEVGSLLDEGFESWPPLKSVGYKECVEHLRGRLPSDKLFAAIVEKTMQLAKKQRTWFKRDPEIHWLSGANVVNDASRLIREMKP